MAIKLLLQVVAYTLHPNQKWQWDIKVNDVTIIKLDYLSIIDCNYTCNSEHSISLWWNTWIPFTLSLDKVIAFHYELEEVVCSPFIAHSLCVSFLFAYIPILLQQIHNPIGEIRAYMVVSYIICENHCLLEIVIWITTWVRFPYSYPFEYRYNYDLAFHSWYLEIPISDRDWITAFHKRAQSSMFSFS